MKKIVFLIILGSILAGCSSNEVLNITQDHAFLDPQNSIIIGKLSIEGVEGPMIDAEVKFASADWEVEYPIAIPEGIKKKHVATGTTRTDFYYFVEIPPGDYDFKHAKVQHETYKELDFYMLNANILVPESSIIYIGTLRVKPIGRTLSMLGPVLEMDIVNEPRDVVRMFRDRYPQYDDRSIRVEMMNRYRLFKDGGIGGQF